MVNLEHLHVIESVCREGSFQKASEKLFKARSAVSYSVKQVESFYGLQIFSRETYRPELTVDGRLLIVEIRRLLQQASEFESFVKQMKSDIETELRLGVGSLFPIEKITDLLLQLKKEFPQTTIHLDIEVASGQRLLLDECVDIAIYGTPTMDKNIDYQLIDDINVPLLISNKLPIDHSQKITEADLACYPQVIMKSTDNKAPDTYVHDDSLKWYVTDLSSKKALIKAGLGWGRMPEHWAESDLKSGELIKLDTQENLNLPIYICKLKNKVMGPVAMTIWRYFQN